MSERREGAPDPSLPCGDLDLHLVFAKTQLQF
jgi:hypothetical protein